MLETSDRRPPSRPRSATHTHTTPHTSHQQQIQHQHQLQLHSSNSLHPPPFPPSSHQAKAHTELPSQASCPAPPIRPPYSTYNSKPVAHFADCSQSSFNVQRQRESPPVLVAHTGSRCPAPPAGAVTVQGVPPRSSHLLSSPPRPLSSGFSGISGVGSRFGVIGIYHGCSVHILDYISIVLFYLLRLDFSTLQSSWLPTIQKSYILKVLYFFW